MNQSRYRGRGQPQSLAGAVLAVWLAALSPPATAGPGVAQPVFITLGTNAGPIPNRHRAEPANLLRSGEQNILVDVGDGAAWQLSKVGVGLGDIQTVILSHLHFDHTGGLFAFLSQRYQGLNVGIVTIIGPPGTRRVVDQLIAAMAVSLEGTVNARERMQGAPSAMVKVVEIAGGSRFAIGDIRIAAAVNTHYSFPPKSEDAEKYLSLSFRFDMPGRSLVYSGDTGPSQDVETLAKGADALFCEIMDPEAALSELKQQRPGLPPMVWETVERHFRMEHLSPTEVGLLASRAGVKALVLTHIAIAPAGIPAARKAIAVHYSGSISFADDLSSF
jgi:ribonuclease BN (tRNA processing enzyme)